MDALLVLIPIFALLFFGLVVVLVIYGIQANKKRVEELAQQASAMKLSFSPTAPKDLSADLSAMSYFVDPGNKGYTNVLYGELDGTKVHLFEYHVSHDSAHPTVTHTGPDGALTSHTHSQSSSSTYTVAYLRGDVALPQFLMYPSSFMDGIAKKVFGMQDIDIATHPGFSKEYVLQGKDEAAVRQVFRPEVLAHCEKVSKITLVGEGERLVVMRTGLPMPNQVEGLLREALALHVLLQQRS